MGRFYIEAPRYARRHSEVLQRGRGVELRPAELVEQALEKRLVFLLGHLF
jgi:hypothetical protein